MAKNRRLKVALFHMGFFYSGGGEKLVLEELRGLRALGHQVTCFAPYVDREGCFPDEPEMARIIPLLPPPPGWLPLKDAIWVLACCLLIPFMAPKFASYDVLYGANQPAPWLTFILSKILRKPYVIYLAQPLRLLHPRQIDVEKGLRIRDGDQDFVRILTALGRSFIGWADRVSVRNAHICLTNGEYVSRWVSSVYGVPTSVCSAGCHPIEESSLEYFVRWGGELRVKGQTIWKPYALLTNRHSPQKRFEYVLWALKMALREVPDLSLVITGQETEYTDMLKYLVEGLRLDKSVHFVGLVSGQELEILYRQAALYVYPAPEEDFGMGIVEAMAAGTPVVAWDKGGPTVTIQNGQTGFLVQPNETDEFSEKMCTLAANPALAERMGRAGHNRARYRFSYERHNMILEQALRTAVGSYDSLAKYPRRGHESVGDSDLGNQIPSLELVMPPTSSMTKEPRLQNDFASHQEFEVAETDEVSDAVRSKI